MSQTPTDEGQAEGEENPASQLLWQMIDSGRSFSGNERHCVFLNTGGGDRFARISAVTGLDVPDDGRAVVLVDWDQDGDLDAWISNRNAPRLRFFRNDVPSDNRYVAVRLRGNGETTNRDAVGARVEIEMRTGPPAMEPDAGDASAHSGFSPRSDGEASRTKLIKTLRAGEGFLSQSSKWLHFGLGPADSIEKVSVRWPGGEREEFTGLDVNRKYYLDQGSGLARREEIPGVASVLSLSSPRCPLPGGQARIPLVSQAPMPQLMYEDFQGQTHPLRAGKGEWLLVTLWASWCQPCRLELRDLATRKDELRAVALNVVALSVDGLSDNRTGPVDARAYMSSIEFPFVSGRATRDLIWIFQILNNTHIRGRQTSLPLPSSFLVNPEGMLTAIYKGPASPDGLLRDIQKFSRTVTERFARTGPLDGRVIQHPLIEQYRKKDSTKVLFVLSSELQKAGLIDEAERQYLYLLENDPDYGLAHYNLGLLYLRQKKLVDSRCRLETAVRLMPDHALAHKNLGRLHHTEGRGTQARKCYHRAVQLHPEDPEPHYLLGLIELSEAGLDRAMVHFEQAVKRNPNLAQVHNNLGLIHVHKGNMDQARGHYEKALSIDPSFADAANNFGGLLMREGKYHDAMSYFQRTLEVEPGHPDARRNLQSVRKSIREEEALP